jgi:hypothetical protein
MGVLLVKCAATEKEFSTGINVDRDSLYGLRGIVTTSFCPHCCGEHAWRLEDTRFVEVIPPDLWAENVKSQIQE